jgi:uncharacterized membrane protein
MVKYIHTAILGLFGAVILHIVSVLAFPFISQNYLESPSIEKILARIPQNDHFVRLEPVIKNLDPNFVLAACRFSLQDGPLMLSSTTKTDFWSLSVFNRLGENIFSINDQIRTDAKLDMIIANPIQTIELKNTLSLELADTVFAKTDVEEGFVVLRIFAPNAQTKLYAEDFMTSSKCVTIDLTE